MDTFSLPSLQSIGEAWTVTLSHEALELILDPDVNLLVMGPHPRYRGETVFHWYEVCDAVQDQTYVVDGMRVSNFVLPLYFTSGDESNSRNDFLGEIHNGRRLRSFGVAPGSYIGFYNPATSQHEVYFAEGDQHSVERLTRKGQAGLARRSQRYQAMSNRHQSITASIRDFLGGE